MGSESITTLSELKCMLCDEQAEPKAISFTLLKEITNDFSEEQEIGSGGFAVVYKGMLDNGVIVAVKRLSDSYRHYEKQFHREIECLIKAKHKNVVRFIGYCANSDGRAESYNGKFVMADVQQRLLCFEYLPHGTLDKHIMDPSCGLDWSTRYDIINGICDGLHYLHQNRIVHLDLKPPNILLDGNMLPKIADFGQSRCFDEKQTRVIATKMGGTMGYLAPEFYSNEITYRFDLFSLGVIIIEMLTGKKGYEAIENVLESWSKRLDKKYRDIQLKQIRVCAEIGMECIEYNPAKRPDNMQHIIDRLHETGNIKCSIETVMAESSTLQVETNYDSPHQDASRVTRFEDFTSPGSSNLVWSRPISEHRSACVAVLIAVKKIWHFLNDEDTNRLIIAKLSEKVTSLKEFRVKVRQIMTQLIMMEHIILQIDTVFLTDEVVKCWIGEVRNVAYHVEDVMDMYSYHVLQLRKEGFVKKFFIKGIHYVNVFSEILNDVAVVKKEILEIEKKSGQVLRPSQLVANPVNEMERQRSQYSLRVLVKDEDLVGIEENRKLLTKWLYSEELENIVITVSGMGGLGKSTLVSNVYEHEKINFSVHAWIVVSQVYSFDDILRKLLVKIGYTQQPLHVDNMDEYGMKKEIQRRLENRKYLIVLDDVCQQEVYSRMKSAFRNLQRSRIVITTRKLHLASSIRSTLHLELLPLGNPDAFHLFCRRAFYNQKGHTCPEDLEIIANAIVDRCHGLPLSIVKIGTMLSSSQELDIWAQKYNQLSSELSNNDHVRSVYNPSYQYLSAELLMCLLYCSLFPEDHPMSRDSLVRMWVAEGFVVSKKRYTSELAAAECNLMELVTRNMLEAVECDELGRVKTCKMHAIVRDLAISMAKEERFASANDYGTMRKMQRNVRRLSFCGWRDNTSLELELPYLRTVVAVGVISYSPLMLSSVLSGSKYLTVLELQDSEVSELPASIGSLLNLCYIGLRRTKVKSLPDCIEN